MFELPVQNGWDAKGFSVWIAARSLSPSPPPLSRPRTRGATPVNRAEVVVEPGAADDNERRRLAVPTLAQLQAQMDKLNVDARRGKDR